MEGWRGPAFVAALACAAHATALAGGYVWLDHAHLRGGIEGGGLALERPGELFAAFTKGFAGTGYYRPLVSVSLSLDAALVAALGAGPWLFHAVSWAWHAAAAALVLAAGRALGLDFRAAIAGASLFAVHPATSLVAGAIAFRSEAMIAVALLVLVVCHLRNRPWGAAIALAAGALTKETALVLGPLFIVALAWHERGESFARRHFRLWAAEAAALAGVILLRVAFAPAWRASFLPMSLDHAIGSRLAALGKTALLALFPVRREVCDAFPITGVLGVSAVFGALALVAMAVAAWRLRGPALLMALSALPALHMVPVMRWWSPHYLYVPLSFAAMLAGQAIVARSTRRSVSGILRSSTRFAAAAAVAGLAALSLHDDLRFRNDESLWRREVAVEPGCREGHFFLGEVERERKRADLAARHYEHALEGRAGVLSYVDRGAALTNLGAVRTDLGHLDAAIAAFAAAREAAGDAGEARRATHNLATAYLRSGDAQKTVDLLGPECARVDAARESLFVCARALARLGREADADELLRRLLTHSEPGK